MIASVLPCSDNERETCLIQLQNKNGDVLKSFVRAQDVEPGYVGMPFLSTITDDKIFIAHVHGKYLSVYSHNGELDERHRIDQSPASNQLDIAALPSDVFQQAEKMRELSFTFLSDIFVTDRYHIIQFYRRGDEYSGSHKWVIDIYNRDGQLLFGGIEAKERLKDVTDDLFYYVYTDDENEKLFVDIMEIKESV